MMEETENEREEGQVSENLAADDNENITISNIQTYEELLMSIYNQEEERAKRIGIDKVAKLSHQLGSVILLDDYEKARAEGLRSQFEVYIRFLRQRGPDTRSIREVLLDDIKAIRMQFEEASPMKTALMAACLPVWIPMAITFGIGITAVAAGVRSAKFVSRLLEGRRIRENAKGKEWEEDLDRLVSERWDPRDYGTDRTMYVDPYNPNNGNPINPFVEHEKSGILDFAEKDIDLEGGRSR